MDSITNHIYDLENSESRTELGNTGSEILYGIDDGNQSIYSQLPLSIQKRLLELGADSVKQYGTLLLEKALDQGIAYDSYTWYEGLPIIITFLIDHKNSVPDNAANDKQVGFRENSEILLLKDNKPIRLANVDWQTGDINYDSKAQEVLPNIEGLIDSIKDENDSLVATAFANRADKVIDFANSHFELIANGDLPHYYENFDELLTNYNQFLNVYQRIKKGEKVSATEIDSAAYYLDMLKPNLIQKMRDIENVQMRVNSRNRDSIIHDRNLQAHELAAIAGFPIKIILNRGHEETKEKILLTYVREYARELIEIEFLRKYGHKFENNPRLLDEVGFTRGLPEAEDPKYSDELNKAIWYRRHGQQIELDLIHRLGYRKDQDDV
jgi:hypothetical protein